MCLSFSSYCSKAINKAYEEYVLSVGNLDERIFLGDDADEEIGTLTRCLNATSGGETAERVQVKHNLQQHFDRVSMTWSVILFLYGEVGYASYEESY